MKLLALHKTNKMKYSLIHGHQNMMILWKLKSKLMLLIFFETIKLSVKSPKFKAQSKSQGELKTKEKITRWNSKMH